MSFKQPRIPEYREREGAEKYLRALALFLKDFSMECWVAVRSLQKGGGLRALTSDSREDAEETDAPGFPGEEGTSGAALYREVIDYIYPIGRTIATLSDGDDPNALYPWQTWTRTAQGRMLIGTGASEENTDAAYGSLAAGAVDRALGEMGGEDRVALTQETIAAHSHGTASLTGGMRIRSFDSGATDNWISNVSGIVSRARSGTAYYLGEYKDTTYTTKYDVVNINASHAHAAAGGGQAHNNMPPYIAANIWKRVS